MFPEKGANEVDLNLIDITMCRIKSTGMNNVFATITLAFNFGRITTVARLGSACYVYHQCHHYIRTDVILKVEGLCSCMSVIFHWHLLSAGWWVHAARVPTVKLSLSDVCHNEVMEIIKVKCGASQYLIFIYIFVRIH